MNKVSSEDLDTPLRQFGPKRRDAFSGLKPHNDLIEGLRRKGASFHTIHQVLRAKGVQTSATMIRSYCQKVLAEPSQGRARKSKKSKARTAQLNRTEVAPKVSQDAGSMLLPTPTTQIRERSTGPRVAK